MFNDKEIISKIAEAFYLRRMRNAETDPELMREYTDYAEEWAKRDWYFAEKVFAFCEDEDAIKDWRWEMKKDDYRDYMPIYYAMRGEAT